ncbi:hypothetical protein, partial [Enterococcus faecium]|uniref:hypothetical protein n=1 Tax=Enterococcus faecium TaxID=1352 RepID=UPI003CC616CD
PVCLCQIHGNTKHYHEAFDHLSHLPGIDIQKEQGFSDHNIADGSPFFLSFQHIDHQTQKAILHSDSAFFF